MNTSTQGMNTFAMLFARYMSPVVPLETIVKDYFNHMQIEDANRRANKLDLPFPVFKSENSKKAKWMVNITQFAAYLDRQSEIANQDFKAFNSIKA
ncbi:pyocin activator PrtN family protein [Acinetobacter radioresistens]|uniref:pyocin activator PrtN family protein n=1 Tax=Acinetobacter radioresistens TaxID=40216 RepID=UPI0009465D57|nr:pyocin activator PrtN family protein [Acinetobacter radioresistens]